MPTEAPIVIGAGVAGLAAAAELARAGLRPRLLESRPFVGGRVRSFVHTASGDEIDNGQHLLMGCYHQTFRLLDLIGTRDLVTLQDRLRVDFRDADGAPDRLLAASFLPSPADVLWGMLRLRRLSMSERLGLGRVAREAMRRRPTTETVATLLDRLRQSPSVRMRLWDPIVIATLNTAPEIASAELFLEVLRRAFLGARDDARLAIPRAGLSRLFEPAVAFITAHGGSVELGGSVTRIDASTNGFTVYRGDREPITTTRLVVAVPPRAAATLLGVHLNHSTSDRGTAPDEQMHAVPRVSTDQASRSVTRMKPEHEEQTQHAEQPGHEAQPVPGMQPAQESRPEPGLELSPIVSLYLWYDRPLEDLPEMTALLGTRVQWVFNRRRMLGQSAVGVTGLLSCTISAAVSESATTADDLIAMADAELRAAFVELDGASLVDGLVVKEKHATFRATPSIASLRPSTRSILPGLYLAGDWTATGLPATIEGAAQSGFDAAAALLVDHENASASNTP